jgi:hypothetical protein
MNETNLDVSINNIWKAAVEEVHSYTELSPALDARVENDGN